MKWLTVQYAFSIYLPVAFGLTPPIPYPPLRQCIAPFEQSIDHDNPGFGISLNRIFNQTYWYNATFWKGPGSPVILFTPSEIAATGYMSYLADQTLPGQIAKEVGGAVVLIEHRYWGNSTPYQVQTTKNLQFLNLDQSVVDFVPFAQAVELPFALDARSDASDTPWIWSGGSYSGALGAWIESIAPGTFWATHSGSGPVEAIFDYWQYFDPIQEEMPKNCSEDYAAIIGHVDEVFTSGTRKEVDNLKKLFGLQNLSHLDDAAAAISSPIWAWQSIQFTSSYSEFYQMCDAIEGFFPDLTWLPNGSNPRVVGLEFKAHYPPGYYASYSYHEWKGSYNVAFFDTYNASSPMFTDQSGANMFDRTWVWMTCNNPVFYYQTGAPANRSTVFSRLTNPDYWQLQCRLFFPKECEFTYASALGKTASDVNVHTKGWRLPEYLDDESRLLWVNGEFDPWRPASVASECPSILISGARHCDDLRVQDAINLVVKRPKRPLYLRAKWTNEFYATRRDQRIAKEYRQIKG
ncbi:peptidase S28 [Daldinia sp. FL1419]|nr:peptidase S28 [Daldinia sp. FL1419]